MTDYETLNAKIMTSLFPVPRLPPYIWQYFILYPHFHCLVTHDGMNKNSIYRHILSISILKFFGDSSCAHWSRTYVYTLQLCVLKGRRISKSLPIKCSESTQMVSM